MALPQHIVSPVQGSSDRPTEDGFVLPTVLGVGLILLVSSLALGYSAYQANLGGIQNLQAAQAEASAETGAATVYNALNNQYFFLARVGMADWKSVYEAYKTVAQTSTGTSKCSSFTLPPAPPFPTDGSMSSTSSTHPLVNNPNRSWTLLRYETQPQSGVAMMTVEGRSSIGNARTQVQYTYSLISQEAKGTLGFPGLLAQTVSLGNNDILSINTQTGQSSCSGNLLCTDCGTVDEVNRLKNSVVDGVISVGPIQWPRIPTPPPAKQPPNDRDVTSQPGLINLGDITESRLAELNCFTKDNANPCPTTSSSLSLPRIGGVHKLLNDQPATITTPGGKSYTAYFYNVNSLSLSGSADLRINIDSSTYPVVLYLRTGSLTMSGKAAFVHSGPPGRFVIYGNPIHDANGNLLSASQQVAQTITLNGGSSTSNLFVYAPTATIGVNGGSTEPDFFGAIWGKVWNGSSSNNAEITVPSDMYQQVQELDLKPAPSIDFRLQSSSSWRRGT